MMTPSNVYDKPNPEEAHFYFVLNDFKSLIAEYGVGTVMYKLDQDVIKEIEHWLDPGVPMT